MVGRILAIPCGPATIAPDDDGGKVLGRCEYGPLDACDIEWLRRGKIRTPRAAVTAILICDMSGAEADRQFGFHFDIGDEYDETEIARKLDEFGGDEDRLRRMACMLVRRHRDLIRRIAEVLLDRTSLSGPELDELVGRSIDDVRPNVMQKLSVASRWWGAGCKA